MSGQINNEYKVKTLYFSAGKNLLADNFFYYKNLLDHANLNKITENCYLKVKDGLNITFIDSIGCGANKILLSIVEEYKNESDIFCFVDDLISIEKLTAVYIYEKETFLFTNFYYYYSDAEAIYMNDCYYNCDRRNYTNKQVLKIAKNYFEKAGILKNTFFML